MTQLVKWEAAKQAIAIAKSIDEVKDIRDKMQALQAYAKQAQESLEVQNNIAEIKLRAEKRAGEMLKEMPKNEGGRPSYRVICPSCQQPYDNAAGHICKNQSYDTTGFPFKLKDLNISKDQSSKWQTIAELPEEELEKHIAQVKASNEELTTVGLIRLAKSLKVKENIEDIKKHGVILPKGKYSTLVVDPPWEMTKINRDERPNQTDFDYPTMSELELRGFPLPDFSADNAHLYLWTTHKYLPSALSIAEVWGFKYQCLMTWVKNVGFTPFSWMYSTEHVLFCTKGNLPLLQKGLRLDFQAKVREHSRKPEEFYNLVKKVSPLPRIDVFSREQREGFDQFGNEPDKF